MPFSVCRSLWKLTPTPDSPGTFLAGTSEHFACFLQSCVRLRREYTRFVCVQKLLHHFPSPAGATLVLARSRMLSSPTVNPSTNQRPALTHGAL